MERTFILHNNNGKKFEKWIKEMNSTNDQVIYLFYLKWTLLIFQNSYEFF